MLVGKRRRKEKGQGLIQREDPGISPPPGFLPFSNII